MTDTVPAPLALCSVSYRHDGLTILDGVDFTVQRGERWVVLGQNGSGKTTLLRIASLYLHPTTGTVDILGQRLGRTDVRQLRRSVGFTSAGLAEMLRPELLASEVVMTAKYAALEPWWHSYDEADQAKAIHRLEQLGVGVLAHKSFGVLSSGEKQRVLLARTLMNDPSLLLLDEPTAALDLGGREQFVGSLSAVAREAGAPATVLVTHHVEEIPAGFTHALLLKDGAVLASGPLDTTVTEANLSACFGLPVALSFQDGRWSARGH